MSKHKSKRKLNTKRVLLVFVFLGLLGLLIYKLFNINIKNIYIEGNSFLTDQEIIDISGLNDYPKTIKNLSYNIEKRLNSNIYILKASVYKSNLSTKVLIKVKENYPLFYYQPELKTVLYDGTKIDKSFSVPVVINQIPNTVYSEFIKNMQEVDRDILNRMSEIQYLPNEVDSERFFVLMTDGNYVYLTLNKFLTINKYLDVIKVFSDKKGILYFDSGEYFDVFDE